MEVDPAGLDRCPVPRAYHAAPICSSCGYYGGKQVVKKKKLTKRNKHEEVVSLS